MLTQLAPNVKETFRLRKSIQIQGFVYTLFFLSFAIACVSIGFVDDPAKYGFAGEHAVAFSVAIGVLFWGGWTLLGVYLLLAYYVERVTIVGSTIAVRSVFQKRRFDVSDVASLSWKWPPVGGKIRLATDDFRITLDLYGFCDEDRLRLIRHFRGLIPADRQTDWPMFCHKVALPLRDHRLADSKSKMDLAEATGDVLVTRRRYDRPAAVLIPVALVIALLAWWLTAAEFVFALPVGVTLCWLILRFSVRSEGEVQPRVPGIYSRLLGLSMIAVSAMTAIALRFAGFSRDASCTVAVLMLGSTSPFFIYGLYRADQQQKRQAEAAARSAPQQWEAGELAAFTQPEFGR